MKGQLSYLIGGIILVVVAIALLMPTAECIPYSEVYTVGDSITAPGNYQTTLDQKLGSNATRHNFAVSGYSCSQVKTLYEQNVPNGNNITVIVFCGINDIALGQTPTQLESTISSINDLANVKQNHLVLVNIVPDTGRQDFCASTLAVNSWLTTFAINRKIPLVDFYHVYYNGTNCYANPTLTTDGLHPNIAGYVILGNTIFQQGFNGERFGTCKTKTLYQKMFGG